MGKHGRVPCPKFILPSKDGDGLSLPVLARAVRRCWEAAGWRCRSSQSSSLLDKSDAGEAGKGKIFCDEPPHQGPCGDPIPCLVPALLRGHWSPGTAVAEWAGTQELAVELPPGLESDG